MAAQRTRRQLMAVWVTLALILSASFGGQARSQDPPAATPEQTDFFEKKVRPLLVTHCYACHSEQAKKLQAGLYLDSVTEMLKGGDSGPAIVPGNPDESILMSAVRYEAIEMPTRGKLQDAEIQTLQKWIEEGAYWPDENVQRKQGDIFDLEARKQSHWSWQALQEVAPPATIDQQWPKNDVDRFILARLEARQIKPAGSADRAALIRRLYFDLIGLPPAPEAVRAFVSDQDPQAYEKLVDQLLVSEHFGEKWTRHWLDLVRYGETCGHEFDYPLPDAFQYRDYLIRALNLDVSYDQLVREHLAGDLLPAPRRHVTEGYNESIIGTGFWFLGEAVHAPTDVRGDEADRIDNQIDVMCKTFLGLTVACARCHDHKFDPIPTTDYYSLAGFLQSSRRQRAMLDPRQEIRRAAVQLTERVSEADEIMRKMRVAGSSPADAFARSLLAATDVHQLHADLQTASATHGVEPPIVQRLIEALNADDADQPQHPLYTWRRLVWSAGADADLAQLSSAVAADLKQAQERTFEAERQIEWFEDFSDGTFAGWYVTGEAFGDAPTKGGQWDPYSAEPALIKPAVADSGRLGKRLRGVLRSPTFVLNQPRIHYRMRAEGARIRLIVDGYVMDEFNALLFADVTLENVDTKGETQWVTQHRDLGHYLGHRAHLELIDDGDGFAAIDRIGISSGEPPPAPPHPINLELAADSWRSRPELAAAYQSKLNMALNQLSSGSLSAPETDLLNRLLAVGLLEVNRQQLSAIRTQRDEVNRQVPEPLRVMALAEGDGEDERVHIRGNHKNLGDAVPRRMLLAVAGDNQPPITDGSGRLELAERIVDPANPFVSRVLVNRIWQHLFGRGIVPSVDDFGAMGRPPSHPQLLDWLARDFIDHGWSMKHAIRQMVLSNTYQMSTAYQHGPEMEAADPDNTLLHRAAVRRIPAESIRDAMLSVAGSLDSTLYGPSEPVYLSSFMEGRGRPKSGPLDGNGRRSIYIRIQRNFLAPMMLTFDMPSPFSTMGRRSSSNVPAQSLILMNDPFVWQQAKRWARRLLQAQPPDTDARIIAAFENGIGRAPSSAQLDRMHRFVEQQADSYQCSLDDPRLWTDVCHAIMNMKEFIYLN